jgi:hypothetical protein
MESQLMIRNALKNHACFLYLSARNLLYLFPSVRLSWYRIAQHHFMPIARKLNH